jgi:hypothetical protein
MVERASTGAAGTAEHATPIPAGALLLHIGVFKTGTTALQETLRHSTASLREHDLLYQGPADWKFAPLRNLAKQQAPQWRDLVQTVARHRGRVMVSSENLCGCSDEEAADIYQQLAGDRPVHILLTVRSLAELLPSTWQQLLKRGLSQSYEDWLRRVIADEEAGTGVFWRRNNFGLLVQRWGALAGPQNVTVVVSDKRQPNRLLRVTEELLDLPPETLHFSQTGKKNQSLSYADAELLRQVNAAVLPGIGEEQYHRLVRLGMFPALHQVPQEKPAPIPLPEWAATPMQELGVQQSEALRASEARIIGDLAALSRQPRVVDTDSNASDGIEGSAASGDSMAPQQVSLPAAAAAVIGTINACHKQFQGQTVAPAPASPSRLRALLDRLRRR